MLGWFPKKVSLKRKLWHSLITTVWLQSKQFLYLWNNGRKANNDCFGKRTQANISITNLESLGWIDELNGGFSFLLLLKFWTYICHEYEWEFPIIRTVILFLLRQKFDEIFSLSIIINGLKNCSMHVSWYQTVKSFCLCHYRILNLTLWSQFFVGSLQR